MKLGKLAKKRELKFLKELNQEGKFIGQSEVKDFHLDLEKYRLISMRLCVRGDGLIGFHVLITKKGRKYLSKLTKSKGK